MHFIGNGFSMLKTEFQVSVTNGTNPEKCIHILSSVSFCVVLYVYIGTEFYCIHGIFYTAFNLTLRKTVKLKPLQFCAYVYIFNV